ncbi:DEAD/DEAH box helicase [Anoxybacillus sp. LAT_35]|nr:MULTISPECIES: DEAD/DEAH box helicase [Anoxybacillus]MCG5025040.1 DEAD/DEAH box helicase [Anoxybacillus flavithermus]MCG6184396.1 DEAD/DEAH box helicase [Anoxybacillus sp. LAT_26]MCG6198719.1 DEAD/DEAH box helicase [Anoxybacillus sp. LAT_38]MCG3085236.1 DEAD/DEAH box helicase [Anoxybacillus sp. LAT27]MCG6173163.1 DEAD/DEAH box helicase [Anoxybacillus sp. LAT_11]
MHANRRSGRLVHFFFSEVIRLSLVGKQLLKSELSFPYDKQHVQIIDSIIKTKRGYVCIRCNNDDQQLFASFPCAHCGRTCTYCRKCIMMGRCSECNPLVIWIGPTPSTSFSSPLQWNGQLSPAQQLASHEVCLAIERNDSLLVWAVCGAGKTEVLFAGINMALSHGKRVCIAAPRTDVVLELAPRLASVFPSVDMAALYGGSQDRGKLASLTVTTTHQLLRYYHAFDVMIVDEVDAFPYSVDAMLSYAVERARKPTSALIYLTATPSEQWQREVKSGKRKAVTIPARYHRRPLPVPTFEWCGNWQKKWRNQRLPSCVVQWVNEHLERNKQAFLFVPHIDLLQQVVPYFQQFHPHIEGVHAEDPKRKDKVLAFRRGQIPLLVTTTILERGVTVPNIDVAVLGAEQPIFTESALVQIAGRVGRSAQYPTGDVRFFHFGKTKAMIAAKRHIARMNDEARKRGLIDE